MDESDTFSQMSSLLEEGININIFSLQHKYKSQVPSTTGNYIAKLAKKFYALIHQPKILNNICKYVTYREVISLSQVNSYLCHNAELKSVPISFYNHIYISKKERVSLWRHITFTYGNQQQSNYIYFAKNVDKQYAALIIKDIDRTLPNLNIPKQNTITYNSMFHILNALAQRFPKVGYCQGMNFIAANILIFTKNERNAYDVMLYILDHMKYVKIFKPNLKNLQFCFYQLDSLLQIYCPLLHKHLLLNGISASLYSSQWFLTLLTYGLSPQITCVILDLFLLKGMKILFKIIVGVLMEIQESVIKMSYEDTLMHMLKCLIVLEAKAPTIINDCLKIKITNSMLSGLKPLYNKKVNSILLRRSTKNYYWVENAKKSKKLYAISVSKQRIPFSSKYIKPAKINEVQSGMRSESKNSNYS
jgi:Rab-GTPase-TBC domain